MEHLTECKLEKVINVVTETSIFDRTCMVLSYD
jgi:hypothetical protein